MKTRTLVFLGLAAALAAAFVFLDPAHYLTLDYVKSRQAELAALYAGHRALVLCGYFLVYVLAAALSVPGALVLTLLAGALFGFWAGLAVVSFASSLGATLACAAARYFLRGLVRRLAGPRMDAVDEGFRREGAFYLFTLRLVPVFPFFLVNLAMGLTPLRLGTYYWVSQLGMLPATAAYVFAGGELGRIASVSDILSPRLLVAFAVLGVLPLAARKLIALARARAASQRP